MAGISDSTVRTIVLVHGGFVDGSGWEEVYKILKKDGYNVSIVQNPTISLADDAAVTKRVLATHSGPVILVGHSYGGAPATIQMSRGLLISPGLLWITASRYRCLSRIPRLALPYRRYCHRRKATFS
ncbi:MAG: alpha/beta hydrolase [Acidobacteriia bacterium]|nr:alpha/beta hydrolase [Terriglobia bacterium]